MSTGAAAGSSRRLLLRAGRLLTPDPVDGPAWVEVADGRIRSCAPGRDPATAGAGHETVDLGEDALLVPGLVDMHLHGGGGASMTTTDPDELDRAVDFHLRSGTTSCLVSLVTAAWDTMLAQARVAASAGGPVLGVHLEGPFLSEARRGVHPPEALLDPTPAAVEALLEASEGRLRMLTLAPERAGALGPGGAVGRLRDAGVTVAVGHTDADADTCTRAVAEGASVATHLFNGMRPLGHRDPGPAAALLDATGVTLELIADGRHVDARVARVALAAAGARRVALVTDAVAATGAEDGDYTLGGARVRRRGGIITAADGTSLGGSDLTLAQAVRFAVEHLEVGLPDAVRSATLVPATALGLAHQIGRLAPGRQADVVVLDRGLEVRAVMLAGRWTVPPA